MTAAAPILLIPAHNEAANLPSVLQGIVDIGLELSVIVVDDGSSDGTAQIASDHGAVVIRHPFNLGYGAALQTGYKYALRCGAPFLVQMDADGQHDPREVPRLIAPIVRDECDLSLGSRFLEPTDYEMGLLKRVGREVFRGLARLGGLKVTDPTSGFQAMNRRVLEVYARDFYPSDYPDVDVLLTAYRCGFRIQELAVNMSVGLRSSSLHRGLRVVYYVYKMMLSIWAASAVTRGRPA